MWKFHPDHEQSHGLVMCCNLSLFCVIEGDQDGKAIISFFTLQAFSLIKPLVHVVIRILKELA
jgi:hypothetical protein